MQCKVVNEGGKATLFLSGKLVTADAEEFNKVSEAPLAQGAKAVVVDMAQLAHIDSNGLGMLITLRNAAEDAGASVSLANPQGAVKALLERSNFNLLFTIT